MSPKKGDLKSPTKKKQNLQHMNYIEKSEI